jgi:hypothetical protein
VPDVSVPGVQRAGDSKSDLGLSPGSGIHPGTMSGVTQRQDVSATRIGSGPPGGPRLDLLTGARQDAGPGSSRTAIREIDPVAASRMDSVPDMRDPRQAAEMRRTVVGQGSVSRLTVCGL